MTTPEDSTAVAPQATRPDPDEVRSQVQSLLGQLDSRGDVASDAGHDIETQARILEQAHDVLVRALESAEQG